jgi:hypothetical protein
MVSRPPEVPPHEAPTLGLTASEELAPCRLPALPGYEVLEEVGRGGMGVVYKARQNVPRRLVALKMILGGDFGETDRLERFRREVAVVARLQHANVVQIHEVGEHHGRPYFTMEYVEGGTLARHLAGRPQAPAEAAALVEQLARAVQHAHAKGIVHRDLKPSNVLLAAGIPKITDFGLAKLLEGATTIAAGPQTQSGAILGTPSYMAPEQAAGKSKQIGSAVDVYALGAILYECLTGQPPFQGPTALDTLMRVTMEEPAPPRRLRPETPRDLEVICLKCLRKEPGKRYATAGELADDLRRFLDGKPIQARPHSALERVGRWARRRKELVYLVGGAVLAAALSLAVLHWLLQPNPVVRPPDVEQTEADLPPDLRLVPDSAFAFVTLRPGDLWVLLSDLPNLVNYLFPARYVKAPVLEDLGREIEKTSFIHPRDIERSTIVYTGSSGVVLLAASRPYSPTQLRKALAQGGKHTVEEQGGKTFYLSAARSSDLSYCPVDERLLVAGDPSVIRTVVLPEAGSPDASMLRPALRRAAENHALVMGFRPSRRFIGELFAKLKLGAEADPVGKVQAAGLVVDIVPVGEGSATRRLGLEVWLAYADAEQAEAARPQVGSVWHAFLQGVVRDFRQGVVRDFRSLIPPELLEPLLDALTPAVWEPEGAVLRATAHVELDPEKITAQFRERAFKQRSGENLGRIAQALLAYHNRRGRLPPAVVTDAAGQPLYSWRVLVLPYLGEAALYRRFHLNRAWDHPSNAPLLEQMPRVFASPRAEGASTSTPYQVLTGPGGLFDDSEGRPLSEIPPGGAGRTLLAVEVLEAVPWSKPVDVPFTAERLPRLGGVFADGFSAALADGSTHFFRSDTPEQILRALIHRLGENPNVLP